ncbi:DUF397 domain-containing protein [Crossiella equi]|uniref:DUF397 domain-containing protein n=1 Tax=Crossiella equi TaxID=130796 RepID=UPI000A385887
MKKIQQTWRKSLRSNPGEHCVECLDYKLSMRVRDSKNKQGSCLAFSRANWKIFVDQFKNN